MQPTDSIPRLRRLANGIVPAGLRRNHRPLCLGNSGARSAPGRQRRLPLLLTLLGLAPLAHASLWESNDWALTSTLAGAAGYDSNLTLSNDGPEDFFLSANPQLTLLRRNSSTNLHLDASVTETVFLNNRQPTQTDYFVKAAYRYPASDLSLPVYTGNAGFQRSSTPNSWLGRRVPVDTLSAAADLYFPVSGKSGVRAGIDLSSVNYRETGLYKNSTYRGLLGAAYQLKPRAQLLLNLEYAEGRSRENAVVAAPTTRSRETALTVQVRGELTAKLSGSLTGGLGQVTYRGGFAARYTLPVLRADLQWAIDPLRSVSLVAYSGADSSPQGDSVKNSRVTATYSHRVAELWRYSVSGGVAQAKFQKVVVSRSDTGWELRTGLAYEPSTHFRAAASLSFSHQGSDLIQNQYNRTALQFESSYRF